MKRSLLLSDIKRARVISTCTSLLQRISALLFSLSIFVCNNHSLMAQGACDSVQLSYTLTNPGCNGAATGTINVTMSGGLAPYVYSWNNGAVTEDLTGLTASVYSVIVTDQNGCMDTAVVTLTQPLPLNDVLVQQNVLCNGGATGYIMTNVSGGTSPYTYSWSNGSQSANAVNLTAGTYIVTVVDYHGCATKDTAEILQPSPINLTLYSPEPIAGYNVSTYLGNDGSIDLSVSGGLAPYVYAWSNGAHTQDLASLTAGVYSVVVADSNACTASASISLDQPVTVELPSGFTPNSDGANDVFVVHGLEGYPDNVLTIFNRWGNIVYQKPNYNNQWNGYNTKGEELPDGTYFAILEIRSTELVLKGYVELKRH
jgi:gliding motility-associated-like protein